SEALPPDPRGSPAPPWRRRQPPVHRERLPSPGPLERRLRPAASPRGRCSHPGQGGTLVPRSRSQLASTRFTALIGSRGGRVDGAGVGTPGEGNYADTGDVP